jgi:hypothetical protein
MSLYWDLNPSERGLERAPGSVIWRFPPTYPQRLGDSIEGRIKQDKGKCGLPDCVDSLNAGGIVIPDTDRWLDTGIFIQGSIKVMFANSLPVQRSRVSDARGLALVLLALSTLLIAGCGSTKVYTANKTMTYKDSLYNMSNVQRMSSRVEGTLANGEVKNMKGKDKKTVEALLKENSPLSVSMIIDMDSQELVYLRKNVSKYSEYSSMSKSLDRAMSSIGKFTANKSSTQLKLK